MRRSAAKPNTATDDRPAPTTAREARTRLGLTAAQLAATLRVTATYVRLCERVGCPSFPFAERISAALKCDIKLFLPPATPRKRRPASVSPDCEAYARGGGAPGRITEEGPKQKRSGPVAAVPDHSKAHFLIDV